MPYRANGFQCIMDKKKIVKKVVVFHLLFVPASFARHYAFLPFMRKCTNEIVHERTFDCAINHCKIVPFIESLHFGLFGRTSHNIWVATILLQRVIKMSRVINWWLLHISESHKIWPFFAFLVVLTLCSLWKCWSPAAPGNAGTSGTINVSVRFMAARPGAWWNI